MKEPYKLAILIIIMSFSHLTTQAQFITFNHDGIDRQYLYYEPVTLNANMPLVFAMHGYTGDANSMRNC
jgi:polyhydroxybutyrate depolymerase